MKVCTKCGIEKPESEFAFRKDTQKLRPICLQCGRDKKKIYYANHRKELLEKMKSYSIRNKVKISEYKKLYCAENITIISQKQKEYYAQNKEYILKQHERNRDHNNKKKKEYREKNRELIAEKYKKWAYENEETRLAARRVRKHIRMRTDPKYKLNSNFSQRMRESLKSGKNGKSWRELVDYNISDLKKHLEEHFQAGMSWSNYGKNGWEIDHKIPIAYFNYTSYNDSEFKMCWALTNLQPLWAKDNLRKGAKILPSMAF